jgi:hypothetical protein
MSKAAEVLSSTPNACAPRRDAADVMSAASVFVVQSSLVAITTLPWMASWSSIDGGVGHGGRWVQGSVERRADGRDQDRFGGRAGDVNDGPRLPAKALRSRLSELLSFRRQGLVDIPLVTVRSLSRSFFQFSQLKIVFIRQEAF